MQILQQFKLQMHQQPQIFHLVRLESSRRAKPFENYYKHEISYHFSLLQKSYHSSIGKATPSLHGRYTPPNDKEIAARERKIHINCRCPKS